MKINIIKLVCGIIFMLVESIVAGALMYVFQRDTINLLATIIFVIVYFLWFRDKVLIERIRTAMPQFVFVLTGILLIGCAMILMPKTMGGMIPQEVQGLVYGISFICWVIGIICLDIRYNEASNKDN